MDVPASRWGKVKLRRNQLELTRCPEKVGDMLARYPYRKPTQVGGHKCAKVYERMLV